MRREEPTVGSPRSPAMPTPSIDPTPAGPATAVLVTPAPLKSRPLFGGDRVGEAEANEPDALGLDPLVGHLAELAAHGRTATPLTIGFVGGAGTGKTYALARASAAIGHLATAAGRQTGSPFLSKIHVQRIDAAALDGDVMAGVAAALYAGLRQPYPELARDLASRARDPHVALRELNEKLDAARHRLDTERRALDDAGSRRARLTETVLYEAAGSQVDAYARANHSAIASRFAAFGIGGDATRSYKEIVQYVAGSGGKLGLILRSLWAYKGQTRLLVLAVLLVLLGVALGVAIDTQDTWMESLRGAKAGGAIAGWLDAHMDWLARARTLAFLLAAVAIACNLWRAFAFIAPVSKGARLLDSDLDTRRRDLDGLFAHQTKRVDTLDSDVERLTREVAGAEKRIDGNDPASRLEPSPFAPSSATQSQGFFSGLANAVASGKGPAAPQRIVLAVDHLDGVAPERGRAILDTLHRSAIAGLVTIVAVDAARLDADGSRRDELARWIEVPVRLDVGLDHQASGAFVARALGRAPLTSPVARNDGKASALDTSLDDGEVALLTELAPLVGSSPRAIKRFVSVYGLARLDHGVGHGALAFMLALAYGGTAGEKAAVAHALSGDGGQTAGVFHVPAEAGPRVAAALASASALDGTITTVDAAAAARAAARFTLA